MAVTCNLEKNVASNLTDLNKSHSLEAVYRVSEAHLQVREIRTEKFSDQRVIVCDTHTSTLTVLRQDGYCQQSDTTSSCNKAGTDIVQGQTAVTVYLSSKSSYCCKIIHSDTDNMLYGKLTVVRQAFS